jgi:hypothetical protein
MAKERYPAEQTIPMLLRGDELVTVCASDLIPTPNVLLLAESVILWVHQQ